MNLVNYVVAISSAIGFAFQMLIALVTVRYFSPNDVGELILISQIGFLLGTVSLAQAQIGLLANKSDCLRNDTRIALFSSLKRFLIFSPICILMVWASKLPIINSTLWALSLAATLMTWLLVQSMSLRTTSFFSQSCVRFVPQLFSLLFIIGGIYFEFTGPNFLLLAALLGYFVGANWVIPVIFFKSQSVLSNKVREIPRETNSQSRTEFIDDRSSVLRVAHSFSDVLLATSILVVWQRLYGFNETGFLAAPLRILGFIPAIVNIAWAQASMSQMQANEGKSLIVGIFGFISVALLGLFSYLLISSGYVDSNWNGIYTYLVPLIFWQGSACLVSSHAHIAFQKSKSKEYSRSNIVIIIIQYISLILPLFVPLSIKYTAHFYFFASISFFCYFFLFLKLKSYSK